MLRLLAAALTLIATPTLAVEIGVCAGGQRITCVVDGDTVWWHGEKLRLAGIDTPEAHSSKCLRQSPLAGAATDRLVELLRQGEASIVREGTDRYRRTLARISVDGRDVGEVLVAEGHARVYVPGEQPWCGL